MPETKRDKKQTVKTAENRDDKPQDRGPVSRRDQPVTRWGGRLVLETRSGPLAPACGGEGGG